ncbi:glycosyltransferase [uncultured Oscillibacter sp.]|uniref:glycosyltransferase n=1 Tax=uncultured Oscillibacter sp. TaxID=876091 RepID=UPI0025F1057C|nr:glycosyltransferase [uncultured Oscillibacter sp.]
MKRIFSINLSNYGSTGSIAYGIKLVAEKEGYTVCCAYPGNAKNKRVNNDDYIICSDFFRGINHRLAVYSGLQGCFAPIATCRLLKKIEEFQPNIIHLHNLHGDFINFRILFRYIKKRNIPVVWTLHDCWAFTARCPHFTMIGCDRWKTGCFQCPYPAWAYPEGLLDQSKRNWRLKRRCFADVQNMTIVTPSKWLENLAKKSFLKKYPIEVIYNGIDLSVFRPVESSFKKSNGITARFILLGVSFGWSDRKGLDVFIELARRLDPKKYQIVLVGTDKNTRWQLPESIISIPRTQSQTELAEIYTAADLFVNPTREETLGLVNIEALACGVPAVTFRTGGSPECIDNSCGSVVECDDVDALECEIVRICEDRPYSREDCLKQAKKFDMMTCFQEYLQLYERVGE